MTLNGRSFKNFKKWYKDVDMIGRYFLVYLNDRPKHKRQYVICNSIVPSTYKHLINLLEAELDGQPILIDDKLETQDGNTIYITSKDYKSDEGVST